MRDDARTTQPSRDEVGNLGGEGGGWELAVLRSIDPVAGTLAFQFMDYAGSPPVVGEYETYGTEKTAYPMATAVVSHFTTFVWPATVEGEEGEDPVENPLSILVAPILVKKNRFGDFVARLPLKDEAAVLPDGVPINACGFGG